MPEYLDALCSDPQLASEFAFGRAVDTKCFDDQVELGPRSTQAEDGRTLKQMGKSVGANIRGCVLSSVLPAEDFHVPERTVIEFSTISHPGVVLGQNTILSHCTVPGGPWNAATPTVVPAGRLYHTVPIRTTSSATQTAFVTVSFAVDDDLKRVTKGGKSLWDLRLFQAKATAEESFRVTMEMVANGNGGPEGSQRGDRRLFSMGDVLEMKDEEAIMEHRKKMTMRMRE